MTPEISEFTYGFALTNELVGWTNVKTVPIFPSLIEEGRSGGGYDVKLELPAVPLYLQFKRSDCMTRRSAKEIRDYNLDLSIPYYRFKVTERTKSAQHELLLELESDSNFVFYVAPRFHTNPQINIAWTRKEVAARSIFVRPSLIGSLDDKTHHISFDGADTFLCSEPKAIESMTSQDVLKALLIKLEKNDRPLRDELFNWRESLFKSREQAREKIEGKRENLVKEQEYPMSVLSPTDRFEKEIPDPVSVFSRSPRRLRDEKELLRQISDVAANDFMSQLIVVQKSD